MLDKCIDITRYCDQKNERLVDQQPQKIEDFISIYENFDRPQKRSMNISVYNKQMRDLEDMVNNNQSRDENQTKTIYNSTYDSNSDEELEQSVQNSKKRKDPLYQTNRFKFSQDEDLVLKQTLLSKLGYNANKLKCFDEWKFYLDKYFQQRHRLEIVRRCMELIQEKEAENQKLLKLNKRLIPKTTTIIQNEFEEEKKLLQKDDNDSKEMSLSLRDQQKNLNEKVWLAEEDQVLLQAVYLHGQNKWSEIRYYLEGKTSLECRQRFVKINPNVIRTWWTFQEDVHLVVGVKFYGDKRWADLSEAVFKGKRNDLQCRERYVNILDPKIEAKQWTQDEDYRLMELIGIHGSSWASIAKEFGSIRTDSQLKCRWRHIVSMNKNEKKRGRRVKDQSKIDNQKANNNKDEIMIQQTPQCQVFKTFTIEDNQSINVSIPERNMEIYDLQKDNPQVQKSNQINATRKIIGNSVKNVKVVKNKNIKQGKVMDQVAYIEDQNNNNPEILLNTNTNKSSEQILEKLKASKLIKRTHNQSSQIVKDKKIDKKSKNISKKKSINLDNQEGQKSQKQKLKQCKQQNQKQKKAQEILYKDKEMETKLIKS
ncbi:myb domain protein 4r1 [Stylonychia lemnae]|uniref:Myb domain protein 4r1 n=1 Tax=Stylonychia lemnae TaxID=5949 RepID=A0A077ZQ88_STYLE|nr:myb domain protein 4r1 [Stylonychia lemnae]|eukprot:CDW71555.1 myb domain protein 4r1 [Stylonychia lemnae]